MDQKEIVFQEINKLNKLYELNGDEALLKMESLLLKYLEKNPQDSEMWIRLAMVEFTAPLEDPFRMKEYIEKLFTYDPYNIKACLLLAYSENVLVAGIEGDLLERLGKLKTDDKELLSMISLAKAWYYENKDEEKYEQNLLDSILYCDRHVGNFVALGRLYFKQNKITKGKELIQKGIDNVEKIHGEDNFIKSTAGKKNITNDKDITDIKRFLDIYYKRIYITDINLSSLKELLNS